MHIGMIALLIELVPSAVKGRTERVVSLLTGELVRRGHEVTLFARADSQTGARLVAYSEWGLRLDSFVHDQLA